MELLCLGIFFLPFDDDGDRLKEDPDDEELDEEPKEGKGEDEDPRELKLGDVDAIGEDVVLETGAT